MSVDDRLLKIQHDVDEIKRVQTYTTAHLDNLSREYNRTSAALEKMAQIQQDKSNAKKEAIKEIWAVLKKPLTIFLLAWATSMSYLYFSKGESPAPEAVEYHNKGD